MATKTNTASASKTTTTAAPQPMTKTAAAINTTTPSPTSPVFDGLMSRFTEAQDALLGFFNAPSWKRTLCAVITYVAGVSGVAFATTKLTEFLFVGALSASVPTFIAIAIAVIAAILLAFYGHRVVMRVAGAIITKEADQRAADAYDAMKNLARRFNPFVKLVPIDQPTK